MSATRTLWASLSGAGFWLGYLALFAWVYLCLARPVSEWRATGWLVDYQAAGWVKRGLPGQVLHSLGLDTLSLATITAITTLLVLVFGLCFGRLLAFFYTAARAVDAGANTANNSHNTGAGAFLGVPLLVWVAVLAPFTLQQALHDLGRFDLINTTLALVLLLALLKTAKAQWLGLLIYPGMALIHEASVFVCVPVLSSLWWVYLEQQQCAKGWFILSHCAFAVSLAAVLLLGGLSAEQMPLLTLQVEAKAQGFAVEPGAVQVYLNDVAGEAQSTLGKLQRRLGHILMVVLLLLPFVWFSLQSFKSIQRQRWHALLPLVALAPLPLFVIGIDFFRWLSAMVLQLWLLLLGYALITEQTQTLLRTVEQQPALRRSLWLQLVLCLYIGPLGVSTFLPERGALLQPKGVQRVQTEAS